jgi:hypothetical protein
VATITLQPAPQKRHAALAHFRFARLAIGDEVRGQRRHGQAAGGRGNSSGLKL